VFPGLERKKSQVRFLAPRAGFPDADSGGAGREAATRRSGFAPDVQGRSFGAGSPRSSGVDDGG
jgi:hypothetical protein